LAGVALLLKGELTSISTILCLAFGVLFMSTAYGLWALKIWSYNLTRVICAVAILLCLLVVSAKGLSPISGLIMIVAIGVLVYLHRKESRTLFAIDDFGSENQSSSFSLTMEADSKSAEQEVSMEGGSVMDWLQSNEVWQRFVIRGLKNPKALVFYIILIAGVLMAVQFKYNDSLPILELDQLDKRTGTLIGVYTVGRAQEPWISLKSREEIFQYRYYNGPLSEMKEYIGQEVVIWSQAELNFSRFGFQDFTRQVQVNGKLIQDYEKIVKPSLKKVKKETNIFFIFPIILISWGLIALWRVNAKSHKQIEEEE